MRGRAMADGETRDQRIARISQRWMMAIAVPIFAVLAGGMWLIGERQQAEMEAAPTVLTYESARPWRAILKCLRDDATGRLPLHHVRRTPAWLGGDPMARYRLYNGIWGIEVTVRPDTPTHVAVRRPEGVLKPDHRAAILHCR